MIGFVPVVLGLPVKRAIEFPSCHGNIAEKVIAIAPPPLPARLAFSVRRRDCVSRVHVSVSPFASIDRDANRERGHEGTKAFVPRARGSLAGRDKAVGAPLPSYLSLRFGSLGLFR